MAIDFENALNDEQHRAVTAPDGPLLVLAAAGTGKTRTLVYRVAYLVHRGVSPDRILLLTFTNRAAREMLERAEALVGPEISGIWGGTFHHMCNRILRRHAATINWKSDFTILDRDDSKSLVSECIKTRKLVASDLPKPDVLLALFGSAANTSQPLPDVIESRLGGLDCNPETILTIHDDYGKRKRELDAMDFDDLLVNCLGLFRDQPATLARYQEQFQHVLVDEYQDTNAIQAELVDSLSAKHRNVLVVGDDFQSIYSWRGADFLNILSFPDRYPDAKTHKLETNYRSVPQILEVANACIAQNPQQFQKTLRATREDYHRPQVVMMRDGGEQARYIIEHIRQLRRSGCKHSEIAILYRAHFHAMDLQMTLTREHIPYVITSGVRFFEQAHIKDVCAVLRILEYPEDEMAFTRLLALLPGIGLRTAQKLWSKLGGAFVARTAAGRDRLRALLKPAAAKRWADIERVFEATEQGHNENGGDIIADFVNRFYDEYAMKTYENFDRRLDDIDELVGYVSRAESVDQFLSEVALITNLDAELEDVTPSDEDAIRLSTVHQAKGQEWSAVIILWLVDGMFPSARTLKETHDGEAEERRLFYVAVTRAKDELCLCIPEIRRNRDGSILPCRPSRFVSELPEDLFEQIRPGLI